MLKKEETPNIQVTPEKTILEVQNLRKSVLRQDVKDDKDYEVLVETGTVTRPINTGRT